MYKLISVPQPGIEFSRKLRFPVAGCSSCSPHFVPLFLCHLRRLHSLCDNGNEVALFYMMPFINSFKCLNMTFSAILAKMVLIFRYRDKFIPYLVQVLVNHYLAFSHFGENYYPFSEVRC